MAGKSHPFHWLSRWNAHVWDISQPCLFTGVLVRWWSNGMVTWSEVEDVSAGFFRGSCGPAATVSVLKMRTPEMTTFIKEDVKRMINKGQTHFWKGSWVRPEHSSLFSSPRRFFRFAQPLNDKTLAAVGWVATGCSSFIPATRAR